MSSGEKKDEVGVVPVLDLVQDDSEKPKPAMPMPMQMAAPRSLWSSVCIVATCTLTMISNTANSTSVSICLPIIEADLKIEQAKLEWLVSAYALSSGCLLLLFGRLADLYGRKKIFILGSLWLIAFTLGCAFAQDDLTLDILRGFQGVGAAATIPAALGTLAHAFPPSPARAVAFATFAAGAPLGGALGMALGGLLVQLSAQTWRSPFYLNAGLVALSLIGALFSFDRDLPSTETDKRIDRVGALLITSGLVLVVFVLGQGEVAPKQWATPYIIALLVIGVFLCALFILWQYHLERVQDADSPEDPVPYPTPTSRFAGLSRFALECLSTPPPLMRLSLWSRAHGRVAVVMWIAFLNWCCFMSWNYWVVLYYQSYLGLRPLSTVARMVPMFITGLSCNAFIALVIGHVPLVMILACGTALTGVAALLFAVINPNATYWAFGFPAAILAVVGADFVFASGTLFVAKVSLPHEQSVAGAVFQTMTQLGTSLGVTVSTVVFNRIVAEQARKEGFSTTDLEGSELPHWIQLKGYRAAEWTNFAFGMLATLLGVIFLRGVGIIGHREPAKDNGEAERDLEEQDTLTVPPESDVKDARVEER